MKKELKITTVNTNKIIPLKELEREFIFSFVLSIISRYKISKWIERFFQGKEIKALPKLEDTLNQYNYYFQI